MRLLRQQTFQIKLEALCKSRICILTGGKLMYSSQDGLINIITQQKVPVIL